MRLEHSPQCTATDTEAFSCLFLIIALLLQNDAQYIIGNHETYLLTGKTYCGLCGSTYIGSRRKKGGKQEWWPYYCCGQRARNKIERCVNKVISRDYLESVVLQNIADTVFSDEMIPILTKAYNEFLKGDGSVGKELTALKRQRGKLKADIDYLTETIVEYISSKPRRKSLRRKSIKCSC